jgi:O-antigen biosynthesis protein
MADEELEALKIELDQTRQALSRATAVIQWMESSQFWKLRSAYLHFRQTLKFPFSHAFFAVAQTPAVLPEVLSSSYLAWQQKNEPRPADLQKLAEMLEILPEKPLISILVLVLNPSESFLQAAIESVINQIYPHWELCIADNVLNSPPVRALLRRYQACEHRIKLVSRQAQENIYCANAALELATGEFLGLLNQNDVLTPDALYEISLLLNRQPLINMIYSDEDKIDQKDQLRDPYFKPDWCPDSLLSRMYTGHFGAYRRSLVCDIGGFRVGFEGSQDYDLVLRLTEKTDKIAHIPKILYHRRIYDDSTAAVNSAAVNCQIKVCNATEKALSEALQRRGEPGRVTALKNYPGLYIVRYEIREFKLVTIIVPTRDLGIMLDRCLSSIFSYTTYPNYEVLVVDNGSLEPATFSVFERWQKQEPQRFRLLSIDIPFNYSKLNNRAVQQTRSDYLLFLNNDVEVATPDWLNAMVEQAQRPTIGAVGARLLYPDGTIQHAGVVAGLGGIAGHSHRNFPGEHLGYFAQIQTVNNYMAVTAACLMCRREVFEEVSGFEENLAVAFNDVDFCFKLSKKGYRNVYLPHVMLYHDESKSRGYENTPEKQERFQQEIFYIRQKWKTIIDQDPCYSPHLTRDREDYSISG